MIWGGASCFARETFRFDDQDGSSSEMRYYGVLIPQGKEGALETFLLDQLCNSADEKERADNSFVVQEIDGLVSAVKDNTGYLKHRRDQVKSRFSLFMSVVQPERAFQPLNKLIESVDWEVFQNDKGHEQFRFLEDL